MMTCSRAGSPQMHMNTNNTDRGFCIIGCGRVGTHLAVFLTQQGYGPAALASRTLRSARNAAAVVPGGVVFENPVDAAKESRVVFITTPDDRIEKVCDQLAEGGGFNKHCIVFHLSGALSSDILSSARQKGAATGSIHPLLKVVEKRPPTIYFIRTFLKTRSFPKSTNH